MSVGPTDGTVGSAKNNSLTRLHVALTYMTVYSDRKVHCLKNNEILPKKMVLDQLTRMGQSLLFYGNGEQSKIGL